MQDYSYFISMFSPWAYIKEQKNSMSSYNFVSMAILRKKKLYALHRILLRCHDMLYKL